MSDERAEGDPESGDVSPAAAEQATSDPQLESPEAEFDRLRRQEFEQLLELRKAYAKRFQWAVYAQLVVADVVFLLYCVFNDWNIPSDAIDFWLGATVVEVIGVVLAITRSVFAQRELIRRR